MKIVFFLVICIVLNTMNCVEKGADDDFNSLKKWGLSRGIIMKDLTLKGPSNNKYFITQAAIKV